MRFLLVYSEQICKPILLGCLGRISIRGNMRADRLFDSLRENMAYCQILREFQIVSWDQKNKTGLRIGFIHSIWRRLRL